MDECNFKPNVGSIGELRPNEKIQLDELLISNKLAFTMGPNDIGKTGYFCFTLPLLNESDTAHQPPREIPIHLHDNVRKEINNWKFSSISACLHYPPFSSILQKISIFIKVFQQKLNKFI